MKKNELLTFGLTAIVFSLTAITCVLAPVFLTKDVYTVREAGAQEKEIESALPADGSKLYDEAIKYYESQAYDEALSIFNTLKQTAVEEGEKEKLRRHIASCLFFLGLGGNQRRLVEAMEAYKDILRDYPGEGEEHNLARYRLGLVYEKLEFHYEAIGSFKLFLTHNKNPELEREIIFKIGMLYHKVRRYPQAIERLNEYLKKYPEDKNATFAIFILGDSYFQQKNADQAEIWFGEGKKRLKDLSELPPKVMFNIGLHEFNARRYQEAIRILFPFYNIYHRHPLAIKALELLSDSYAGIGQFEIALVILSLLKAKAVTKEDLFAVNLRLAKLGIQVPDIKKAVSLSGMDSYLDPVKALDNMLADIKFGKKKEELLYLKGEAQMKKGQPKESLDAYLLLLRKFPQSKHLGQAVINIKNMGQIMIDQYYLAKDYLAVAVVYNELNRYGISVDEDYARAVNIADSFHKIGQLSQARSLYSNLLGRSPGQRDEILLALLNIALEEKNYDEVEKQIIRLQKERGAKDKKIVNPARMILAESYFRRGMYKKAAVLYRENYLAGADFTLMDFSNYADSMREINNLPMAVINYERIIKSPDPGKLFAGVKLRAQLKLAECLYQLNKFKEGIDVYKQILTDDIPKSQALWITYQMAEGYKRLKNLNEAERHLVKLKELSQNDAVWSKFAELALSEMKAKGR